MIYNSTPGLNFRGADMVRNLVLSCHMDKPLSIQEQIYRENWLFPFELKFSDDMDRLLLAFTDHKLGKGFDKKRHVSKVEEITHSQSKSGLDSIGLYGRFVSLFEATIKATSKQSMGPPLVKGNVTE
jgi:hypothetical protein